MHFGIFLEERRQGTSDAAAFQGTLELAELAEAWGLDGVWHRGELDRSTPPAPGRARSRRNRGRAESRRPAPHGAPAANASYPDPRGEASPEGPLRRRVIMARLTPITNKNQVAAQDHAIVDAIVESRGALQGPFTMFLHCPELAGRLAHLGAFVRFEGSLDMRVRVLAAMTVAREFEAIYVWGAQSGGGAKGPGGGRTPCPAPAPN